MSPEVDLGPVLSRRLTYLLKRLTVDLDRLHDDELASTGLDVRTLGVLMFLNSREPESQQQIGQELGVDRTTMVALIDSLERQGMVVRRPDADDRRRNVVVVTDAGHEALRRATRASDKAEARLLSDLNAEQAGQLRALLLRVAAGDAPARNRT